MMKILKLSRRVKFCLKYFALSETKSIDICIIYILQAIGLDKIKLLGEGLFPIPEKGVF